MRIQINDGSNTNIRICFPTGLALNRFTALFLPAAMEQQGIHVTREQALAFVKAIRECKRKYKDLTLVEVSSAGGAQVRITL